MTAGAQTQCRPQLRSGIYLNGIDLLRPKMPKPCAVRDRLREDYHRATLRASNLSGALQSLRFGTEFQAALDKAAEAFSESAAARALLEEHCKHHGCDLEFSGPIEPHDQM